MDGWQTLLDGEAEEWRLLLREEFTKMESIAQKLAWEMVALTDRGDYLPEQLAALEICYGVALAQGDPGSFSSTMKTIEAQVSDSEMQRLLRLYTARGLKQ